MVIKVNVDKVNVKVNVNKVNDKVNDIYSIHSHYKGNHKRGAAAGGRGTSFVVARPQAAPPLYSTVQYSTGTFRLVSLF